MSEQSASVELVRHEAASELGRPLPPMDDGEVAALWRQAKALADSGLFKGAKAGESLKAGQAFAKMLAGRDLGLSPFESMQQLHVMPDGKLEASSDLHATKVRQRDGYDFEVWWVKQTPRIEVAGEQPSPPAREVIRAADEDPTDLRETVGCAIVFAVDGQRRGVSTWTVEDTLRANLNRDRGGKTSPHVSYPRSMYYARAMTNGVAWYVPEVMGGVRVYGLGEVSTSAAPDDLTTGPGKAPAMDDLPTEVEAVLARARELGHAGLANRDSAVMAVRGRSPADVERWVKTATRALNAVARGAEPAKVEPEPPEAEVVPERCGVEFGAGVDGDPRPARCELPKGHDGDHVGPMVTPTQNEAVSAPEGPETPTTTSEAADGAQAQPERHEADESGEVVDAQPVPADAERAAGLRAAAVQLLEDADAAEAEGLPEEAERLRADAADTKAEADALGDAGQPSLEF